MYIREELKQDPGDQEQFAGLFNSKRINSPDCIARILNKAEEVAKEPQCEYKKYPKGKGYNFVYSKTIHEAKVITV